MLAVCWMSIAYMPSRIDVLLPRANGRVSPLFRASEADPTLDDLKQIVRLLALSGKASNKDIERATANALDAVAAENLAVASTPTLDPDPSTLAMGLPSYLGPPTQPGTITDAKRAFSRSYAGSPLRSPTVKFANVLLETTCVWKYRYSRAWALGFAALCDAFLAAQMQGTRLSSADQSATRSAICYALGMDAAAVAADADALLATARSMTANELLATGEFVAIAQASGYKYTYAFGVGLITLMYAVGEVPSTASIDRWCTALNLSCARTLERDFIRPLSIDGVGRYSFESPGEVVTASLEGSIGLVGDF